MAEVRKLRADSKRPIDIAYDLRASFSWNETPQGHAYWAQVCVDLESLTHGPESNGPNRTADGGIGMGVNGEPMRYAAFTEEEAFVSTRNMISLPLAQWIMLMASFPPTSPHSLPMRFNGP